MTFSEITLSRRLRGRWFTLGGDVVGSATIAAICAVLAVAAISATHVSAEPRQDPDATAASI